jgi:DNA-binding transcriptional MerR regulator
MAHLLTIGQVAKTTGVAAKTIRFYEQVGILPLPNRTRSGYRQYDQTDIERLRFIRRARSLGLPLERLKTLASSLNGAAQPPTLRPQLLMLIRGQLSAVQHQIGELLVLQRQLQTVSRRIVARPRGRQAGACRCLETEGASARRDRRARRSRKRAWT